MILRTLFFISIMIFTSACEAQSPGVRKYENIPYCKGGEENLLLDVFIPEGASGLKPAVLFVHGGGWVAGSKQEYHHLMQGVARNGYVAIGIDYRLVPASIFPAQIEDVKCAVRWTRAHAGEYGIDPSRIGMVGASAGAHLASLSALTQDSDEFDGTGGYPDQSDQLQALILHGGVYDISPRAVLETIQKETQPVVPAFLGDEEGAAERASPISYIHKDSPPMLFLHGVNDPIVSVKQAQEMAARMKAVGAPAEILIIPDSEHLDFGKNPLDVWKVFTEFLDRHLKTQ